VQHVFRIVHGLPHHFMSVMLAFDKSDFVADFRQVSSLPEERSSSTTRYGAAHKLVTVFEPINPAPPVTR